jgi:hypothetical protein
MRGVVRGQLTANWDSLVVEIRELYYPRLVKDNKCIGLQYEDESWAFRVWTEKEKVFLMGDERDTCPIYYFFKDKTLYFASDFLDLLDRIPGSVFPRLDIDGLAWYMLGDNLVEKNLFKDVFLLKRFEKITIVGNGMTNQVLLPGGGEDNKDWDEELREGLVDMIEKVGEDKIGLTLSGGVDSALLAGFLKQIGAREINTYSMMIPDKGGMLQRQRISYLMNFWNLKNRCIDMEKHPPLEELREDKVINPYLDIYKDAMVPMIKQAVGDGVKVIVTGFGGDELFHIYGKNKKAYSGELLGWRDRTILGCYTDECVRRANNVTVQLPVRGEYDLDLAVYSPVWHDQGVWVVNPYTWIRVMRAIHKRKLVGTNKYDLFKKLEGFGISTSLWLGKKDSLGGVIDISLEKPWLIKWWREKSELSKYNLIDDVKLLQILKLQSYNAPILRRNTWFPIMLEGFLRKTKYG